ncbi:hypothetical protein HMPREF1546_01220 [Oscillibacter sp. KLE 1745]|nr:hypothetical protein HMPREF1546_01220 [Oscillibacter sp. KLE 1745]
MSLFQLLHYGLAVGGGPGGTLFNPFKAAQLVYQPKSEKSIILKKFLQNI